MLPVWLVVPVLILGVAVGAGLGWWMRQRTLTAGLPPQGGTPEPASAPPPPVVAAPAQPAPPSPEPPSPEPASSERTSAVVAPPVVVPPEQPASGELTGVPAIVATPAEEPPPAGTNAEPVATSEQLDLEPQPESAVESDLETQPEASEEAPAAAEPSAAADAPTAEGERLGARMEDVLSELERRYRGRRVDPGQTREEPDSAPRPRRRRPQS